MKDYSGASVSMNSAGDIVAIGAFGSDATGSDAGHVRVYQRDTTAALGWTQIGADIDGEATGDRSGYSVSMNAAGNRVAIGAERNDATGKSHAGHVRVYQQNTGSALGWTQIDADIDGEAADDLSGHSVSMNALGDIVAIGALGNDATGSEAGHVRVYQYTATPNYQLLPSTSTDLYEQNKTVVRVSGDYNYNTNNYKLNVKRTENGTQTPTQQVVRIAHVAPQITIVSNNGTRMRSGGNDGTNAPSYTVQLTSDQVLKQKPTLAAPVATLNANFDNGTIVNGDQERYNNTMLVEDDDRKGEFTYTSLQAIGMAGVESTTISSGATYELGGFVSRSLTLKGFGSEAPENGMGVLWSDYSKVRFTSWTYPANPTIDQKQPIGTTGDITGGWTITGQTTTAHNTANTPLTLAAANKPRLKILDANQAAASTGVSTVVVEEIV